MRETGEDGFSGNSDYKVARVLRFNSTNTKVELEFIVKRNVDKSAAEIAGIEAVPAVNEGVGAVEEKIQRMEWIDVLDPVLVSFKGSV
jgi:hypothetical protein